MKLIYLSAFIVILTACSPTSKDDRGTKKTALVAPKNMLDATHKVIASKKMSDGIQINWFQKGKGKHLEDGDLVMIDYKVKLTNGKVVDGNHFLHKKSMPFLLGFGLQTKGWDLALKELQVGDFARIHLPSELARGKKGIKGWIPPNSENDIYIRILSEAKPTRVVGGTKVWILEENKRNKLKFNSNTQIIFHGIASSPSKPMYANTFRTNNPITFKYGDYGLVPGLVKALENSKKSDRMFVLVPSNEAYGSTGYLDCVKPNESVFYNIFVMDVVKK
jgi:FKBP-type peptidyl-prolyl cis-trans isomerase